MLTPQTFRQFGGLRLDLPPDQVPQDQAIDLLDVESSPQGGLQTRPGAAKFNTAAKTYSTLFAHSTFAGSTERLLTRRAEGETKGVLVALNTKGEEAKVSTASEVLKAEELFHAYMGTPSASYSYVFPRFGLPLRFDGTNFTEPTATVDGVAGKAMPRGAPCAVWPEGGYRLVLGGSSVGPGGATSSTSHAWISDAGNAESWHTVAPEANFEQLTPGDGEKIIEVRYWGGQIFIFKQTKLFVFYGVNVDNEGAPEFNFRVLNLPSPVDRPANFGSMAWGGAAGLYFVARDGIYVTTGQQPVPISGELRQLEMEREVLGPAAETLGAARFRESAIFIRQRRLFVILAGAAKILVHDFDAPGWWVWSSASSGAAALWDRSGEGARHYFVAGGNVYRYEDALNTDASVNTSPRWQSGFYDLGSDDRKSFTVAKVSGEGAVKVKVAGDYGALGTSHEFDLGEEGTAIDQKNVDQHATLFSHQFSGAAPWSVQRFTRYLRETEVPAKS